jgi:hypothetical protein
MSGEYRERSPFAPVPYCARIAIAGSILAARSAGSRECDERRWWRRGESLSATHRQAAPLDSSTGVNRALRLLEAPSQLADRDEPAVAEREPEPESLV